MLQGQDMNERATAGSLPALAPSANFVARCNWYVQDLYHSIATLAHKIYTPQGQSAGFCPPESLCGSRPVASYHSTTEKFISEEKREKWSNAVDQASGAENEKRKKATS